MKSTITNKFKMVGLGMILVQLMLISSCKVDVESPNNLITKQVAFSNDASATSALLGIYSTMSGINLNDPTATVTINTGLMSDELSYNGTTSQYIEYATNSVSPSNVLLQTHWTALYKIVYQCNQLLDALKNADQISSATKNQLSGEAMFIRALMYYYLINEFGDVPLVVSPDYDNSQKLARTPILTIQQQILEDLINAKSRLSESYPSSGRVRVNKYAASAFLAKFYLYLEKFAQSETEASAIISSGQYSMETDLANVFLPVSKEAILQIMPSAPGYNTALGNSFIPSSATAVPNYSLNSSFLNAIEIGDKRKNTWMIDRVVKGKTYTCPYKYKVGRVAAVTEYTMIFRLADLYLVRAEARAQQDKIPDAIDDLNIIRSRARDNSVAGALPAILTTISKPEALAAIARERRVELFTEGPNRWVDLKRSGQLNAVMSVLHPTTWQNTDQLFPIPQPEILLNPNLKQNPGYN